MTDRCSAVDEFYSLMDDLEEACGGKRVLANCNARTGWPARGVYFFFENSEFRDDGVSPRVVRIGTHGLRPSKSTLWARLSQHKGNVGGSLLNGGNHRGSVFRLHVGTALLATAIWPEAICRTWSIGANAAREVRQAEYPLELKVSECIRSMPFLWVDVGDEPSPTSDRGVIERGAIGLLSNLGKIPIDAPSADWLGRSAAREQIRGSGLWNVNHVAETPDLTWLQVLESRIRSQSST
jgi:hypothetical protein